MHPEPGMGLRGKEAACAAGFKQINRQEVLYGICLLGMERFSALAIPRESMTEVSIQYGLGLHFCHKDLPLTSCMSS